MYGVDGITIFALLINFIVLIRLLENHPLVGIDLKTKANLNWKPKGHNQFKPILQTITKNLGYLEVLELLLPLHKVSHN